MSAHFRGCPNIIQLLGACLGPPQQPPATSPSTHTPHLSALTHQHATVMGTHPDTHSLLQPADTGSVVLGPAALERAVSEAIIACQDEDNAVHAAQGSTKPVQDTGHVGTQKAGAAGVGIQGSKRVQKQGSGLGPQAPPQQSQQQQSQLQHDSVPRQVALIMELAEGNLAQRLHGPHQPPLCMQDVLRVRTHAHTTDTHTHTHTHTHARTHTLRQIVRSSPSSLMHSRQGMLQRNAGLCMRRISAYADGVLFPGVLFSCVLFS